LRSFVPADITIDERAQWQHTTATDLYKGGELDAIERYLHWLAAR